MNIALFDGSFKNSFISFLRYKNKFALQNKWKLYAEFLLILPLFIAYKLGFFSEQGIKNLCLGLVFKNILKDDFNLLCARFSTEILPSILRPLAMQKLNWHKQNGDKIVIVSASLEEYLAPWCEKNGFELIASKLDVLDGRITGKLDGLNCHGDEKVRRIKEKYDLNSFEKIYAYGDTKGDLPMLKLAHESFYKPFREF